MKKDNGATKMEIFRDTIIQGDCLTELKKAPDNFVDCCFTSSPYWGKRDYGLQNIKIWDGNEDCEHEFTEREVYHSKLQFRAGESTTVGNNLNPEAMGNPIQKEAYCKKCGAWKGQLGLEPHPSLFVKHIVDVFHEVKRVLKPTGTLFLNLGDTYFGGKGKSGRKDHNIEQRIVEGRTLQKKEWTLNESDAPQDRCKADGKWLRPKQKMLIPERIAIAMQDDGWILRNSIIWHKLNHMPESVADRLTCSYEPVYFFTKSEKYYFNLDSIRRPHQTDCKRSTRKMTQIMTFGKTSTFNGGKDYNPLGGNPGDVWTLTTEPSKVAHFATFPTKLVRRGLLCGCPAGGLVLDPFTGSGTTLYVARRMALHYLGIEMNPKYAEIARKRLIKNKFIDVPPQQLQLSDCQLLACNRRGN